MIKENYTEKELRSIYKDAKYNWSKNCEPLELASNDLDESRISLFKFDGDLHIVHQTKETTKYENVVIKSFDQFMKFYKALITMINN